MNVENNAPAPELQPLVYTVKETAMVLRSSTKSVRRLIKRRLLRPTRIFRKLLIPRSQVEELLRTTCDEAKRPA